MALAVRSACLNCKLHCAWKVYCKNNVYYEYTYTAKRNPMQMWHTKQDRDTSHTKVIGEIYNTAVKGMKIYLISYEIKL